MESRSVKRPAGHRGATALRPASPPGSRWKVLGFLFLLALIGVVYFPGLYNTFIGWDDYPYIRDNPLLRSADGLARIWTTLEAPQYYPLTFTSYWVQYQIWGSRPMAYFIGNVILHALNVLLLSLLLRTLGAHRWVTWLACALFALHPIQVGAVAWMAERKTLLAAFFFLVSFLLFLRYRAGGSRRLYVLMLITYLASILSKTVAFTLIGSVLLAELWVFERRDRNLLWLLLPLVVLTIGPVLVVASREQALHFRAEDAPLLVRPLFAAAALWTYVLNILAPIRLLSVYPEWGVSAGRLVWWLPLLAVLGAGFACWRWRQRIGKLPAWGLGHFGISLLPAIGLVRFGYLDYSPVADHLVYFAMMGAALCLAVVFHRLAGSGGHGSRRILVSVAVAGALLALSVKTWSQVHIWRDPDTFWNYNLRHNPVAPVAHLNLGAELAERGEFAQARSHLEYVVNRTPRNHLAQTNLAGVLLGLGQLEESLQRAQLAVQLEPDHVLAHIYLGAALAKMGRLPEAVDEYQVALRLEPSNTQAMGWMAEALQQLGRFDESQRVMRDMLRVDPRETRAHLLLGNLQLQRGNPDAALMEFHEALRLNPNNIAALRNTAMVLVKLGRLDEAAEVLRQTMACVPGDGNVVLDLAGLLDRQGRSGEAVSQYRRAVELMPESAAAQFALATALGSQGDVAGAVAALRRTVELDPQSLPAHAQLAWILATASDPGLRDPAGAVRLAEKARDMAGDQNPAILDVLAASYAAVGRFPEAIQTAQHAIELARNPGSLARPEPIEQRLNLYRKSLPFVMTPASGSREGEANRRTERPDD